MYRLLILRHAKAIPYAGRDDYERTLTDRGRADAARIAGHLATQVFHPDMVVHSGAARARETTDIVLRRLPRGIEVATETTIYDASWGALLNVIREFPDDCLNVMLVGHNPGLAEIVRALSGRGEPASLAKLAAKFPTAGLASIEFASDSWADVSPRTGNLLAFVTPGDLGGEDS
jgi:phosphohistidine phosphatase